MRRLFSICATLLSLTNSVEANEQSLQGQAIIGYQGWFTCPGDAIHSKNWGHWLNAKGELGVDMLPKAEISDDRCMAPFPKGSQTQLYSSADPRVSLLHVKQIKDAGYSAIALQRFVSGLSDPQYRTRANAVLNNMTKEAKQQGEKIIVMYDVSGADQDKWVQDVKDDWQTIVKSQAAVDGTYLTDQTHLVIAIWGFGVGGRQITPTSAMKLIDWLRHDPSAKSPRILGGVPINWASKADWRPVYLSLDVISPWTVSELHTRKDVENYTSTRMKSDLVLTERNHVGYMPVVFPGFSDYNLKQGHPGIENIPRDCGKFYQAQIDAYRKAGAKSFYAAMFDEFNEGTALANLASNNFSSSHLIPSLEKSCGITDAALRSMIRPSHQ